MVEIYNLKEKKKMSKSLYEICQEAMDNYGTKNNIYADFLIGTEVKIIVPCQDFSFFYGETGTVIRNEGRYLSIIVEFHKPRKFKGGHIQKEFNFKPEDLCHLELVEDIEKNIEIEKEREPDSERFYLIDL